MTNNIEGRLNRLEHKQGGGGREEVTIKDIGAQRTYDYKGKAISNEFYEELCRSCPGLVSYVLYRAGERVEAQEEKVTI